MTVSRVVALAEEMHGHLEGIPLGDRERHEQHLVETMRAAVAPYLDADPQGAEPSASPLAFSSIADLAERVDSAGPRKWLIRGLWPAGDYGVHAAEMKAGKTWTTVDLAVSVAAGVPWLGHVEIDDSGPVLMFAGEGGEANILRRLRAVAESRGVVAEELPITICTRSPHLADTEHLESMRAEIKRLEPRLVTLDPFYLSARGAQLGNLYEMGALLEAIQHMSQDVGASLLVVTHWNRGQGRGAGRITGAGPAEWGRVLISAKVISRHTDSSHATNVITELDFLGGEIPDQTLRVQRRIWSDDPDDLNSALHLEVTVTETEARSSEERSETLPPAARKLLEAFKALEGSGTETTNTTLVDSIADRWGHGLKRETTSRTLNDLKRRGFVDFVSEGEDQFAPKVWQLTRAGQELTYEIPA